MGRLLQDEDEDPAGFDVAMTDAQSSHSGANHRRESDVTGQDLDDSGLPSLWLNFLSAFKSYIINQCNDDLNSTQGIRKYIEWLEIAEYHLVEQQWFADNFPESLEHSVICETYALLAADDRPEPAFEAVEMTSGYAYPVE